MGKGALFLPGLNAKKTPGLPERARQNGRSNEYPGKTHRCSQADASGEDFRADSIRAQIVFLNTNKGVQGRGDLSIFFPFCG